MVDTRDLDKYLSALSERREVECRKFKEALTGNADGNLEPSLKKEEDAETRHDTPNEILYGEGIVQTTNGKPVMKVIVARKSLGQ